VVPTLIKCQIIAKTAIIMYLKKMVKLHVHLTGQDHLIFYYNKFNGL
jgi:hypothetical protein